MIFDCAILIIKEVSLAWILVVVYSLSSFQRLFAIFN